MNKNNFTIIFLGVVLLVGSIMATWYLTHKALTNADAPALPGGSTLPNSSANVPTPPATGSTTSTDTTKDKTTATPSADTTGKATASLVLQPGFNLISIPFTLLPNDGPTVFSGLNSGEAWGLKTGAWFDLLKEGNVISGKAYWVKSQNGEVYDLPSQVTTNEVDTSAPFTISLEKGWNTVGNPFASDIKWNPTVKTAKGSTTLDKAIEAKIISASFASDPVGNKYLEIKPGDTLRKYQGLLVEVGGDNMKLVIDPTVSIVK